MKINPPNDAQAPASAIVTGNMVKPENDLTCERVTVQTGRLIGAKPKRSNPDLAKAMVVFNGV